MKPPFIKAELETRNENGRSLAARLGVDATTVHRVIHGKSKSRRIADEIARVTSLPLEALFPGQYPPARVARVAVRKPIKRVRRAAAGKG